MTCDRYEEILDGTEPGVPPPEEFLVHARKCTRCALALRVEETLASAPTWASRERMSPERRADVLAKAHVGILFRRNLADLATDSAVTALVLVTLFLSLIWGLPPLLEKVLPPSIVSAVAPALNAAVRPLLDFAATFKPLLQRPEGMALGVGMVLLLFFAMVVSARLLVLAPRR